MGVKLKGQSTIVIYYKAIKSWFNVEVAELSA